MEAEKQSFKMTVGKFEAKRGSRGETSDSYIFDSIHFDSMDKCLKRKTGALAQLNNSLRIYLGFKPDNDIISIYDYPDSNGNLIYYTYQVKDCTVQFFDDKKRRRSYLLIFNEDYKKREKALSVLEEVFA